MWTSHKTHRTYAILCFDDLYAAHQWNLIKIPIWNALCWVFAAQKYRVYTFDNFNALFPMQNDLHYLLDFIAETWLIIYIGKFVRWSMDSCQFKSVCVNIRINYVSTLLVFLFISIILGSFSQTICRCVRHIIRCDVIRYDTMRSNTNCVPSAHQSISIRWQCHASMKHEA